MIEWVEAQFVDGLNLRLIASPAGIRAIEFAPLDAPPRPIPADAHPAAGPVLVLTEAIRQLHAYFDGRLREFDLPLEFHGTTFQQNCWRQLLTIPFGQTWSYMQMAQAIGSPKAVRAVGAANGANPIAIVVPCHRVIGANGKLVGYGGGLPLKKRLLALEGAVSSSLDGFAV
jgi:methylated-DNA-[protein]-cysteine S-methyltransferase